MAQNSAQEFITKAKASGYSEDEIAQFLQSRQKGATSSTTSASTSTSNTPVTPYGLPKAGMAAPGIPETAQEKLQRLEQQGMQEYPKNASEFNRKYTPAAAGIAATTLTGSPLAGSAAMGVTDTLFKKAYGEGYSLPFFGAPNSGNEAVDFGADAIANTLFNEGAGKALGLVPKAGTALLNAAKETEPGVKAFKTPFPFRKGGSNEAGNLLTSIRDKILQATGVQQSKGSVVGAPASLDLTYPQYKNAVSGTGLITGVFGKTAAIAQEQKSTALARGQAEDLLTSLAGKKVDLANLESIPESTRKTVIDTRDRLQRLSNQRGELVSTVGNQTKSVHPIEVSPAKQVATGLLDPNGAPIMTNVPAQTKNLTVVGPVPMNNLVKVATALKSEVEKSLKVPDPENPLVRDLNNIIERASQKDANGNLIPMSFKDAWKSKQDFGDAGFGSTLGKQSIIDARYKRLYTAANEDIKAAFPNWNNGSVAAKAYADANAAVNQRLTLFSPQGKGGNSLKNLLYTNDDPASIVDKQLNDYKELQKFKATGNLRIPGTQITQDARLDDLKAYKLGSIIKKNTTFIDSNPANTKLNIKGILDDFNTYAESPAGNELYNRNNKNDIRQFLGNIEHITGDSTSPGMGRFVTFRIASQTFGLGAGLIGGLMGGAGLGLGAAAGTGVIGGAIGLTQMAKLLNDPTTARLMIAMGKQGPLNMSTQMAARLIGRALRGQPGTIELGNGTQVQGTFNKDGKLEADLPR